MGEGIKLEQDPKPYGRMSNMQAIDRLSHASGQPQVGRTQLAKACCWSFKFRISFPKVCWVKLL